MNDKQLYTQILGMTSPWEITDIKIDLQTDEININILYNNKTAPCTVCGLESKIHDRKSSRRWRHLDSCQLKTYIISSIPRATCPKHGVKIITVPWAEALSRYTKSFEQFAIELLQMSKNQTKTGSILRVSFDCINNIMHRAVKRGLSRRTNNTIISTVGIDEKSFKSNHHYITVLSDLSSRCVIDVAEHRTEKSAQDVINKSLTEQQKTEVTAICMDMWKAFNLYYS